MKISIPEWYNSWFIEEQEEEDSQEEEEGINMEHQMIALVGIIMASIVVPLSTIAILKTIPNGAT